MKIAVALSKAPQAGPVGALLRGTNRIAYCEAPAKSLEEARAWA